MRGQWQRGAMAAGAGRARCARGAALGVVLALTSGAAAARAPFGFAAFNQSALARHAPLPAPEAATAGSGGRITLDWTNDNVIEQSGGETLRLDGETLRIGVQQRWQRGDLRWGIELPLLVTGGGVLDGSIETWHHWFGLPNGGREQVPRDEYVYRYVRDGQTVFDLGGSDAALGDLRLSAAHCAADAGCWRALLQLPTGNAERLLGGGLGLAGWYERGFALDAAARWTGALGGGLSALRGDGPLEAAQRSVVPFGWVSLGYALTPRVDAGVQLYGHGALHDGSRLDALRRPGGQVVFGLRYTAPGGAQWRIALQEDPVTASSPDFVIHWTLDWGAAR